MRIKESNNITYVIKLLNNYKFNMSEHYCYNMNLIEKVSEGPYKVINMLKGSGRLSFFIVFEDETPIIIAPLFKNKHELFVVGGSVGWDYTDLFYLRDSSYEKKLDCMNYLLNYLKKKGFRVLRWDFLPSDSLSFKLLEEFKNKPIAEIKNVGIKFDDYNSYLCALSKSVRQNLRTAENRIIRENKTYELLNNINQPLPKKIVKECIDLYCTRQKNKYKKNLLSLLMIKTINFQTQMMVKQKGIFFVLQIDGKVASFMFGYHCENSLEIPKLAIDDTFKFYSPGMVLVNKTIEYLANETQIRYLDLCRGTESYKFKMGGQEYYTYNYFIEL